MVRRAVGILVCVAALTTVATVWASEDSQQTPCGAAEASQFDFWVGRWDVYAKGKLVGHNHISRIQGGCTLLEEYETGPGGFEGKSFNYYDSRDDHWHQVWVDNSGQRLHLSGGFADGRMVMSGERRTVKGTVTDRITWTDNGDGTVQQLWDVSRDGGTTWQTVFDGDYRPASGREH